MIDIILYAAPFVSIFIFASWAHWYFNRCPNCKCMYYTVPVDYDAEYSYCPKCGKSKNELDRQ